MTRKGVIITDVEFWTLNAGSKTRISTLIAFLALQTNLTILYLGIPIHKKDLEHLTFCCEYISMSESSRLNPEKMGAKLATFFLDNHFDFCIIEYIHIAYLLEYIPKDVISFLDIHDITSAKSQQFKTFGYSNLILDLPIKLELEILAMFDYIIVLSENDLLSLKSALPLSNIILVSHPPTLRSKKISKIVTSIGFIGSNYPPNIDALHFFIDKCWPQLLLNSKINFCIGGHISYKLSSTENKRIKYLGYLRNLSTFYDEIDIAINPVRFGAGIKIKNLEALGHGVPLVTTPHGSLGLKDAEGRGMWIAHDPNKFIQTILDLASNFDKRLRGSKDAHAFINEFFSEEKCFGGLLKILNNL